MSHLDLSARTSPQETLKYPIKDNVYIRSEPAIEPLNIHKAIGKLMVKCGLYGIIGYLIGFYTVTLLSKL